MALTAALKAKLVDVGTRAAKTFAQSAGAAILASGALGLFDLNFANVASVAGLAALLSLLNNVALLKTSNDVE